MERWKWEKVEENHLVTEWTLKGPDVLCRYWYNNPPSEHARLIAAAPELLGVLEEMLEFYNSDGLEIGPAEKARAVIAKVKGG